MRRFLLKLLLAVGIPALLLAGVEAALRRAGYGVPSRLFIPAGPEQPDFVRDNPLFTQRFFGPQLVRNPMPVLFPAKKPAGEYRVFLLGESAAMGDPIPEFSVARMLDVILRDAMPDRTVRVVNAAITAINSHVIRIIAAECARFEPDAFVVYMGNNEIVGPYGPGTVFPGVGRSAFAIQLSAALRGTRVAQALESLLRRWRPPAHAEWEGMEMFLQHLVRIEDPRLAPTRTLFAENLAAIHDAARKAGAHTVLCTVGANLRDCSPLASPRSPDSSAEAEARARARLTAATEALANGQPKAALAEAESALAIDLGLADGHYIRARSLDALNRMAEARSAYRAALELDGLRFRVDSAINGEIRRHAADHAGQDLTLVDIESALADSSADGIPGESFFYDHVHLNFAGQYLIASLAAEALLRTAGLEADPLPESEVAAALGWTPWQEFDAMQNMFARRLLPPFANQVDRKSVERRWAERLTDMQLALPTNAVAQAADALARAAAERPDDAILWRGLGALRMAMRDYEGAGAAFSRAVALLPHHAPDALREVAAIAASGRVDDALARLRETRPDAPDDALYVAVANELVTLGDAAAALPLFQRAWERNPANADALVNIGAARAVQGQDAAAIPILEQAVRLKPRDDIAWANLGLALYRTGREAEGIEILLKASALNPRNAETHNTLGVLLHRAQRHDEARERFAQALVERPLDVDILRNAALLEDNTRNAEGAAEIYARLARLLPADASVQLRYATLAAQRGRFADAIAPFAAATKLLPDSFEAWFGLGASLGERGRPADAVRPLERAVSLQEDSAQAHYALGQVLLQTGAASNALAHLRRALEIENANAVYRRSLAWTLATHSDPTIRNPAEALAIADALATDTDDAWMRVDIRAAALAADGRTDEAAELIATLRDAPVPEDQARAIRDRARLYREGRPFVEDPQVRNP